MLVLSRRIIRNNKRERRVLIGTDTVLTLLATTPDTATIEVHSPRGPYQFRLHVGESRSLASAGGSVALVGLDVNKARIGFSFPPGVPIFREEMLSAVQVDAIERAAGLALPAEK